MTMFNAFGPCDIPLVSKKDRRIETSDFNIFWGRYRVEENVGCFMFAMCRIKIEKPVRVSKYSRLKPKTIYKYIPYFVETAPNSFRRDCFKEEYIEKYQKIIFEENKLKPVIFFVLHPELNFGDKKSPVFFRELEELKTFLVQSGRVFNIELSDLNGKMPSWGIKGIIRGEKGGTNKHSSALKSALGFNTPRKEKLFYRSPY